MQVEKDRVVEIDYKLTDDSGNVIDTSDGREPLAYLHGVGGIIPGLESALAGKSAGEQLQVVIEPEDGYGPYDEGLRQQVARDQFAESDAVEVGMRFRVQTPDGGEGIVEVVQVDDQSVVIDGNHPLAGVRLHMDVTIKNVREATEQELEHGHVHEEGRDH